jgi:hypothetical protein
MDLVDGVSWVLRGLWRGVAWLGRALYWFDFLLAPFSYFRYPYTCTGCGKHHSGPPAKCGECGGTRFTERRFWRG